MTPVYVPHTYRYRPTWDALAAAEVDAIPVWIKDEFGYCRYMRARWTEGRDFVNVEHDVIVKRCQLDTLETCLGEWCCFCEAGPGAPSFSLVRFRAPFIAANPRVWDTPLGWTGLDGWLAQHADRQVCRHLHPPAVNVRPYGALHG